MTLKVRPKLALVHAIALAALLGMSSSAKAALLAYEGFDYGAGVLIDTNLNGGFGFAQPWQPNLPSGANGYNQIIIAGSFTYTDQYGNQLVTSGNRAFITGDGSTAGDNTGGTRHNAQPFRGLEFHRGTNTADEVTWISFLAHRTGLPWAHTNGVGTVSYYGRATSFQLFVDGSERLSVGRASQNAENNAALPPDTWALFNRGAATLTKASTVSWTNPPPDLLVVRINHIGGANNPGNDVAYLWINPPSLTNEPAIGTHDVTIWASEFGANDRDYNFNRIRLFAGNWNSVVGYGSMEIDEIRIGETYFDVVPIPEPATAILLGLGGLAFVLRVRNRR